MDAFQDSATAAPLENSRPSEKQAVKCVRCGAAPVMRVRNLLHCAPCADTAFTAAVARQMGSIRPTDTVLALLPNSEAGQAVAHLIKTLYQHNGADRPPIHFKFQSFIAPLAWRSEAESLAELCAECGASVLLLPQALEDVVCEALHCFVQARPAEGLAAASTAAIGAPENRVRVLRVLGEVPRRELAMWLCRRGCRFEWGTPPTDRRLQALYRFIGESAQANPLAAFNILGVCRRLKQDVGA